MAGTIPGWGSDIVRSPCGNRSNNYLPLRKERPAAARKFPGNCADVPLEIFPAAAWTLPGHCRAGAGQLPGKRRGSAAGQPVAATALSDKGLVSHKTERLSIPESRKR
jgi:hypothetical protein